MKIFFFMTNTFAYNFRTMNRSSVCVVVIYIVAIINLTSCQQWERSEYNRYHKNQVTDRYGWGYFVITVPAVGRPYFQTVQQDQVTSSFYLIAQQEQAEINPLLVATQPPVALREQEHRRNNPVAQPEQMKRPYYPPPEQNQVDQTTSMDQKGGGGNQVQTTKATESDGQSVMTEKPVDDKPNQTTQVQTTKVTESDGQTVMTEKPVDNKPNQMTQGDDPFKELQDIQILSTDCNQPPPVKPNFTAPGRRISEAMCRDYVWQNRFRRYNKTQSTKCTSMNKLNLGIIRVTGGKDTVTGEYPHMGALGWKAFIGTWIFKCGSTLISPRFVLTAAHCTNSSEDTRLVDRVPKIVRLGDKNIIDATVNNISPTDVNIANIIVHSQYKSPITYFDIALIQLAEDVKFTELIQPACLWTKSDISSLGKSAKVTGWGDIESGARAVSPELQQAEIDIIDSGRCEDLLTPYCNRRWCGLEQHQLCAGKLEGGVDTCGGDSGGPLQVKIPLMDNDEGSLHYLIGVTSSGFGCGLPNAPGVYTRVSSFIDWIEDQVWGRT